eukprot:COSAG05_NODE_2989_length_2433_cov_2.321765_1_plen_276_part_00
MPPLPEALLSGLVQRAAALLRLEHPALIEGLQVIRYAAGQHYHAHADYHTGRPGTEGFDRSAPGFYKDPQANRFATLLIYLSDEESAGFAGGETSFPLARCPADGDASSSPPDDDDDDGKNDNNKIGLLAGVSCEKEWPGGAPSYHQQRTRPWGYGGEVIGEASCTHGIRVTPRRGDAVLFYSMPGRGHASNGSGHVDSSAFHAGCAVLPRRDESAAAGGEGVKLATNLWFFNQIPAKFVDEQEAMVAELSGRKKARRRGRKSSRKAGQKSKEDL